MHYELGLDEKGQIKAGKTGWRWMLEWIGNERGLRSGNRDGNSNRGVRQKARRITRRFQSRKRLAFGGIVFAALVGFRSWGTFALEAAVHRLWIRCVASEAIEGSGKQHNGR